MGFRSKETCTEFASYRSLSKILVACSDASRLLVLGATFAGVYRQLLCRHCSEQLELVAPFDRAAWARARETVHIYEDARDGSANMSSVDAFLQGCRKAAAICLCRRLVQQVRFT
jgi:hypothetical protein